MQISDEWFQTLEEAAEIVGVDVSDIVPVKKVDLGKLVEFGQGKDYRNLEKGQVKIYGSGGSMKDIGVNCTIHNKPALIIPRRGILDQVYYVEPPFWAIDTVLYTQKIDENMNIRYLYHFLNNLDLYKYTSFGANTNMRVGLTNEQIKNIIINIPNLTVQDYIAEFLDRYTDIIEVK